MLSDTISIANSWTMRLFDEDECPIGGKLFIKPIDKDDIIATGHGIITYLNSNIFYKVSLKDLLFKTDNKITNEITINSNTFSSYYKVEFYPENHIWGALKRKKNIEKHILKMQFDKCKLDSNIEFTVDSPEFDGNFEPFYSDNGELVQIVLSE